MFQNYDTSLASPLCDRSCPVTTGAVRTLPCCACQLTMKHLVLLSLAEHAITSNVAPLGRFVSARSHGEQLLIAALVDLIHATAARCHESLALLRARGYHHLQLALCYGAPRRRLHRLLRTSLPAPQVLQHAFNMSNSTFSPCARLLNGPSLSVRGGLPGKSGNKACLCAEQPLYVPQ